MERRPPVFDQAAAMYDRWFDSPEGRPVFSVEVSCLRRLSAGEKGRWLEVGVGTGRFARALGIDEGVDPSTGMLAIARQRHVRCVAGKGENLPFFDSSFDGVMLVTAICFMDDPEAALLECSRVARPSGIVIAGIIPAEGAWGRLYIEKGRSGHSLYSAAQFYSCDQVIRMAGNAGLWFDRAASCLFSPPKRHPVSPGIEDKLIRDAGFVAMRYNNQQSSQCKA
jgi:ubiquinone/menaquinone biosynthesis C-methylase UbiE